MRKQRGFTLFEILIVMVIISIIMGMAVLSFPNPAKDRLKLARERMQQMYQVAQDEAIFEGKEIGINYWKTGYAFMEFDGEKWLPIEGDRQLKSYELPDGIQVSLVLEGIDTVMPADAREKPQVYLFSSGEATPFEVIFNLDELKSNVFSVDIFGREVIDSNEGAA